MVLKDTGIIFGLTCVLLIALLGIFAPWLAPQDPNSQILEFRNKPPGFSGDIVLYRLAPELPYVSLVLKEVDIVDETAIITDILNRKHYIKLPNIAGGTLAEGKKTVTFWLGTDQFGRDILSRIIYGARISLMVGFSASIVALVIGVFLGALAGINGGITDTIIMRFTDVMFGFPTLLFLIGITAALEPNLNVVFLAVGLVTWPGMARLVRGQVLQLKEQEFIQSAKALGLNKAAILWRHIFPNSLAPIIVTFTLGIAGAIMAEASLSFLGLGAQPPTPSWGAMINSSKDFLRIAPWSSLAPGTAIAVAVLGFNILGDSVRDILDPKMNIDR
ncbi:MAG TPA: ABC transporter permease [Candidatus Marinimicrobia bacterium]|jgi:peptide/nickel transport system permease protein/oligopeptide transport system permease protein|nr:peptide ABC transporter permease [Candidatus Neomarinimicrobiota bacterium]MDP7330239.1 ABC transporter permease [Candidatus Neomarinimicrobiota bacterium]HJL74400.1 ABC transporter permease [Candidatus Neomarinimicrobiota bacterium]HJM69260.1 ABC transporter permease [Candidatus Neomarinimicrobiota bacterium]|tara:strand:+ start:3483 stop:4478 length:996 start_codon:yes stop_codon:yes gene_type:complete